MVTCLSQCTCILQVKLPVGKVQYVVMEPTRVLFHLESQAAWKAMLPPPQPEGPLSCPPSPRNNWKGSFPAPPQGAGPVVGASHHDICFSSALHINCAVYMELSHVAVCTRAICGVHDCFVHLRMCKFIVHVLHKYLKLNA